MSTSLRAGFLTVFALSGACGGAHLRRVERKIERAEHHLTEVQREVKFAECETAIRRLEQEAAALSASCALQQAKACQCVADASKHAADSTLFGCILGGFAAVLTGGAGLPLALAGCGMGRVVGDGENQCVMPTCDAGESASMRATLARHRLERSPMCGGWVGAKLTTQLVGGASVEGTVEGSDAERMGIMGGDVVLRINDDPVYDKRSFQRVLSSLDPGATLEVDTWREGALRRLRGKHTQDVIGVKLGPVEMVPALVRVAAIEPGSPAEIAGLRDGDVIYGVEGTTVLSIDHLRQMLATRPEGETVSFQLLRSRWMHYTTIELARRDDANAF